MTPTRLRLGLAAALLLALGATLGASLPTARAAKPEVICTQVRNNTNGVDEAQVARFMADQLDEGRERFQTIRGVSTVLCAY